MSEAKKTFDPFEKTERTNHPSFGVIGVSHYSGRVNLFGSDIQHYSGISLTIRRAEHMRDLHTDWIHGKEHLIEVLMSHDQFARMITTPGVGDGVPCTIRHVKGEGNIPLPPDPKPVIDKFKVEAAQRVGDIVDVLQEAQQMIKQFQSGEVRVNKGNLGALQTKLDRLKMDLTSNLEFINTCLQERMEQTVTDAIFAFESHVNQSLQSKGLQHLKDSTPSLEGIRPSALQGETNG